MILKDFIKDSKLGNNILGTNDKHLSLIMKTFMVKIKVVGSDIIIDDTSKELEKKIITFFDLIATLSHFNVHLIERDIVYIIKNILIDSDASYLEKVISIYLYPTFIVSDKNSQKIYAKTLNQKKYYESMINNEITFGLGPAGTGKTFLAVCYAVWLLKHNKIKKIILTRPAVEAGEQLGFLPGDFKEKIDPYLTPLYDALYLLYDKDTIAEMITKDIIEIAPLGYMRGRTMQNTFVILDEAQNATYTQLKMFVTRLGFSTKMVITGDPSQVDLVSKERNRSSSLAYVEKIFSNIEGISIVKFDSLDVVRHPLVGQIIDRYNKYENSGS